MSGGACSRPLSVVIATGREPRLLERLNAAMEHIEQHLDGEIEPADLTKIVVTSEYHLRRLFSSLAGMPLSEYIRRRRMTVAGAQVLAGRETLLDIAVRYGYGSGEAFARAFRAVHGVSPGEARRDGAALHSQPRMSFRLIVEGSSRMRSRSSRGNGSGSSGRPPASPSCTKASTRRSRRSSAASAGRRCDGSRPCPTPNLPASSARASTSPGPGGRHRTDYYHGVATPAATSPPTWTASRSLRGPGRCSTAPAGSRRHCSTSGGTCSPSGSRRIRIRAGRDRDPAGAAVPGCDRGRGPAVDPGGAGRSGAVSVGVGRRVHRPTPTSDYRSAGSPVPRPASSCGSSIMRDASAMVRSSGTSWPASRARVLRYDS